jgi:Family of unknown function (DUF5758)
MTAVVCDSHDFSLTPCFKDFKEICQISSEIKFVDDEEEPEPPTIPKKNILHLHQGFPGDSDFEELVTHINKKPSSDSEYLLLDGSRYCTSTKEDNPQLWAYICQAMCFLPEPMYLFRDGRTISLYSDKYQLLGEICLDETVDLAKQSTYNPIINPSNTSKFKLTNSAIYIDPKDFDQTTPTLFDFKQYICKPYTTTLHYANDKLFAVTKFKDESGNEECQVIFALIAKQDNLIRRSSHIVVDCEGQIICYDSKIYDEFHELFPRSPPRLETLVSIAWIYTQQLTYRYFIEPSYQVEVSPNYMLIHNSHHVPWLFCIDRQTGEYFEASYECDVDLMESFMLKYNVLQLAPLIKYYKDEKTRALLLPTHEVVESPVKFPSTHTYREALFPPPPSLPDHKIRISEMKNGPVTTYSIHSKEKDSPHTTTSKIVLTEDKRITLDLEIIKDGRFQIKTATEKYVTPEHNLIGWKLINTLDEKSYAIVKLIIPKDALIDTGNAEKFRTNRCFVEQIYKFQEAAVFDPEVMEKIPSGRSLHDRNFVYAHNAHIHIPKMQRRNANCGEGIHFFLNTKSLIEYQDNLRKSLACEVLPDTTPYVIDASTIRDAPVFEKAISDAITDLTPTPPIIPPPPPPLPEIPQIENEDPLETDTLLNHTPKVTTPPSMIEYINARIANFLKLRKDKEE